MNIRHRLAHLLRLNGCFPNSEFRGEVLWMRLRCRGCGEICRAWPTGIKRPTCDTANGTHYFNNREDRCDCGASGMAEA